MKPVLHVIVCSTRPHRVGSPVGQWAHRVALAHGGFDVQLVELADVGLPLFDEPEHPKSGNYQHAHTRRWSQQVDGADAFVFVMPEYNYGPPPSWLNAMTYLVREWHYKPAAFVSYGGVGGGMRAVQVAKQLLTTFKVVPLLEAVAIPWVARRIVDGAFEATPEEGVACEAMLKELLRWAEVLPALRSSGSASRQEAAPALVR
ncbi:MULTISPECIES: NADPH-dependent FMN reductase [unclassified Variovorax]|uniref:NADPH-dependent FMN reductase n=1 Tax=unclassified Variovorax TaxID=663243 RepID=UPI001BD47498|nr:MULTISPECIES: NAD(P)H-dependent oxidoreductase [unclassified Variovorax]